MANGTIKNDGTRPKIGTRQAERNVVRPANGAAIKRPRRRIWIRGDKRPGPKLFEVRASGIHNRGVFASADIPAGTRIVQYLGERVTKAEGERRAQAAMERSEETGDGAVYLFSLNKRYDIDGSFVWNTARLINHSCEPNCEVTISRGRIWIVASRDIPQGDEITFNYGFDLEGFEDHPCFCGSARCAGFIAAEEFWPELRQRMREFRAS